MRIQRGALIASLLVYCAIAVAHRWWPSVVTAPLVALLLWRRHRRAALHRLRVLLRARGALIGAWALAVYALAALASLQTTAARAAWPRLTWGRARSGAPGPGDRMRGS